MTALAQLLRDEKTISAYEVHLSSLVPTLLHCLRGGVVTEPSKVQTRVKIFKRVFADTAQETPVDLDTRYAVNCSPTCTLHTHTHTHTHSTASTSVTVPSVGLVRKLVSVLEAVEKLTVHSYEPPGQVLNLQILHRRFKLSLEKAPGAGSLLDCSGKTLKVEPLVCVDALESFLNGIVSADLCYSSIPFRPVM